MMPTTEGLMEGAVSGKGNQKGGWWLKKRQTVTWEGGICTTKILCVGLSAERAGREFGGEIISASAHSLEEGGGGGKDSVF